MFGGWDDKGSLPRTWWWGERGLVAALFHDLSAIESLDRWRAFLSEIAFPGQVSPWGELGNAHVVVEPSFGSQGFGRPDAVAILGSGDSKRLVIFFEAKLCGYLDAAEAPMGRNIPGFNSSINGQLELNHRLGLALENCDSRAVVQEQKWVLSTPYSSSKIRSVKDRAVLDRLLTPIVRLPRTSYLHVILTADVSNPFDDPENVAYLPQIFVPDSADDQWPRERSRFGWSGWSRIVALSQGWSHVQPPVFLDTWAFLAPKLNFEDPAVSKTLVASVPNWTATRRPRGVSLVLAPRINSHTYLHFSWRQNNCALRDYSLSSSDVPQPNRTFKTDQVLPLIEDELPTTIQRPAYTDATSWHQRVIDANRSRGL